jgi:hypothetical protein
MVFPETAMLLGFVNPVTSEAFTVAPDVVYSPIEPPSAAPLFQLTTKRSFPDCATPQGLANPVTSDGFTDAPDVSYAAIPPGDVVFVTNI